MTDNGRGQLLRHKANGVYTPTTEPVVRTITLQFTIVYYSLGFQIFRFG